MKSRSDQEILTDLRNEGESGMNSLFNQYYNYMCHAVYRIIPDQVLVEDIVQEVFYELWRKRENLFIEVSLKAYLRRACINKALNYLRDQKIKFDDEDKINENTFNTASGGQRNLEISEFEQMIHQAIDKLPLRCRAIFMMSRFEDMSYQEIANSLEISIKTVENQISKALKFMRNQVYPYLKKNKL